MTLPLYDAFILWIIVLAMLSGLLHLFLSLDRTTRPEKMKLRNNEISIHDYRLGHEFMTSIDKMINDNLDTKKINIHHSKPEVINYVMSKVNECKNLKFISLINNELTESVMKNMCNILKENNSLTDLSLNFSVICDDGIKYIDEMLKYNNIENLYMCNIPMNTANAKYIYQILDNGNCKLRRLYLSNCQMTDDGIKCIADALKHNGSLEHLSLRNNRITDVGVAYISEMLKINISLSQLHLANNNITNNGANMIYQVLQENNRTLEKCYLKNNMITESICNDIYSRLSKNSAARLRAYKMKKSARF